METTTSDARAVIENGMGLTCLWTPWRFVVNLSIGRGRKIAHASLYY